MSSDEDERKKRSINEMFGDEDSDSDGDDTIRPASTSTTTADASGLFGSDSESEEEDMKPKARAAPPPTKRSKPLSSSASRNKSDKSRSSSSGKKKEVRRGSGDEYDSGDEVVGTKEDEDFIDGDDDLADVLGEYDDDNQRFDDERPMDELPGRTSKEEEDEFFEQTLNSLKTGRRSKMKLSAQEMEQITQEMLYRMDKAHQDDLASIAERRPALEKIKYVDNALMLMRKHQLQPMLLDFDLLSIIKKWIHPLDDGTLPNVGIRTKMLNMVADMPVFKEHLKRSGFGKVVMMLWKHPEETRENKDLCRDLIERWSRSVFNKTLDFSKLAELEAEKAENAAYRRQDRRQKQQKTATSGRSGQSGDVFQRGGSDNVEVKSEANASDRAALPQQLRFDFLHRPRPKVEVNNVPTKKADPDSRKFRLAKRMQDIAKPGKKGKRAVSINFQQGHLGNHQQHVRVVARLVRCALGSGMGITRVQRDEAQVGFAGESTLGGVQQTRLLHVKKSNEVRTCASLLDCSSSKGHGDNREHGDQQEDGALDCEKSAWYTNQANEVELTPHMTSRLAALNRELKALEVRYFRTRLQLDKSMEKVDSVVYNNHLSVLLTNPQSHYCCLSQNNQLRQDMTKLRGNSTKLERETCKLRNLIDRIQGEKKQLELQAINNRDYAKKIEQRFFMGTKGQSIIQCNIDLSSQVKSLEKLVAQKDAAFDTQRFELQDAHEKLRILKRALETRFEEMQINGSLHTGILFELTRLQDQSTSLALQLSEERKNSKTLKAKLSDTHAKESSLDEALLVREAMIGHLERERVGFEEKLATLWNEKQTFAFEKSTLLKFIQEQAEVKFQLDAQIKQVHEAKIAELASLHQKLQFSTEEKAKLQDSLRESSIHGEKLEQECQSLKGAFEDEQHAKIELQMREQELSEYIQHLTDDLSKKDDDFKAARDVCRELQTAVESYEQETQELRNRISELESIESDLRQQIAQKQSEELALRAAMENALHDLEMLSKQRNEAAKAMNEAVTISASSLDEQQALESKIENQRKQLEQLKNSKNLLQNAMLEQLSALRKQLQLERIQRIDAEAKVKQLFEFSSPSRKSQRAQAAVALRNHSRHHQHHESDSRVLETAALDPEEPQPLPPPMMADAPSPLPGYLSNLGHFRGDDDARSESSFSSSSSDSDEDIIISNREATVKPLVLDPSSRDGHHTISTSAPLSVQISPATAASPLSNSPEHRAGQLPPLCLEEQISLLELAEGDL